MHYWGDEWFKNNGNELYKAIDFIDEKLRKAGISCISKEKYGTRREDMLRFWDGGLYQILFGTRCYIGTFRNYKNKKIENFVNKIHHWIYFKLDLGLVDNIENETIEDRVIRQDKYWWKGLCKISEIIGIKKLINKYQEKAYNKAYQIACKKWPMVIDELIVMIDGYKMIKPCKWGNIDGEKIHNKYWKTIDQLKNEENLI